MFSNRGECGVFAMASLEANCATITRFVFLIIIDNLQKIGYTNIRDRRDTDVRPIIRDTHIDDPILRDTVCWRQA